MLAHAFYHSSCVEDLAVALEAKWEHCPNDSWRSMWSIGMCIVHKPLEDEHNGDNEAEAPD